MAADGSGKPFWGPSSSSALSKDPSGKTYRSSHHSQSLLSGVGALRERGLLFDVVLRVEGRTLPAHRVLLAASCEYFRGMFTGGLREMDQEEVRIQGVSFEAMRRILDFVYSSELEIGPRNVEETLSAACQLQMPEVMGFCCDFLASFVDAENLLDLYRLADLFALSRLSDRLDAFVLDHFVAFSRTEAYRRMPLDRLFPLLCSDRLRVGSECEVYQGALLYHFDPEELETMDKGVALAEEGSPPPRLLEAVRFPLMDAGVLRRLHDRLGPCPLRETVAGALLYHRNEALQPVLQTPRSGLRSDLRCVVAFGGMRASPPAAALSSQAWFLDPSFLLRDKWRPLTTASSSGSSSAPLMSNQGLAVLHGFVYLVGGDNNVRGFRAEARCWRYDPRHNRWFQICSLQQEHADLAVCVLGEHIYAVAGRDYRQDLREVERYDPRTNAWEYVAPLRKEVYAHAGASLEGKMYVACGRRGEEYLKELRRYDPRTDRWEDLPDSPFRRAWHAMAAMLGRLYVIGGSNNDAGFRKDVLEVACYSPSSAQWTTVSPLPGGHGEPGLAVLDHYIYVLGGRSHNRGVRTDCVHVYDAEEDRWEQGPSLESAVSGVAACAIALPRSLVLDAGRRRSTERWRRDGREEGRPDLSLEETSVLDSDDFEDLSDS